MGYFAIKDKDKSFTTRKEMCSNSLIKIISIMSDTSHKYTLYLEATHTRTTIEARYSCLGAIVLFARDSMVSQSSRGLITLKKIKK